MAAPVDEGDVQSDAMYPFPFVSTPPHPACVVCSEIYLVKDLSHYLCTTSLALGRRAQDHERVRRGVVQQERLVAVLRQNFRLARTVQDPDLMVDNLERHPNSGYPRSR